MKNRMASFIPPADIRDLRELCRYRLKLTCMRTSEKNRYQNSMTVSKIRLDSVFTDPFGKSASSIMSYLINTDPEQVSDEVIKRKLTLVIKYITAFELTPASTDDWEGLRELMINHSALTVFGDKGYIGEELSREMAGQGICLIALKRSNSRTNRPKQVRRLISRLCRRDV